MSDSEIINKMMKLEFKIDHVLALDYKADVVIYRERIEFLKAQLKAAAWWFHYQLIQTE